MSILLPKNLTTPHVLWMPNAGPQTALVNCPVFEVFFGGARGGGKTEGMLGDWLLHEAKYGQYAKGVFFRRTLPQLEQVIERSKRIFILAGAIYREQKKTFIFPSGATLKFRFLDKRGDADNYQGHEYTRIYLEEITNWADPAEINKMRATLRSSAGVPCCLRMTGNPGGVGHSWVKARFIDAAPPMTLIKDQTSGKLRVFIPSVLDDNPHLDQVEYMATLADLGSPALVKAWQKGDWNIIAGAFLGELFDTSKHVVEPFAIPAHWTRWRAMDWGSSRPYCVLWFAQDEQGNVYVYREAYGVEYDKSGIVKPNVGTRESAEAVGTKVLELEAAEVKRGIEIRGNVADPAIWAKNGTELSIEEHFRKVRCVWQKAEAGAGSRVQGAQEIVRRLRNGSLYFFKTCVHTVRTISAIPHSPTNPEDVDTNAEDHAWDALRYGLRRRKALAPDKSTSAEADLWLERFG